MTAMFVRALDRLPLAHQPFPSTINHALGASHTKAHFWAGTRVLAQRMGTPVMHANDHI